MSVSVSWSIFQQSTSLFELLSRTVNEVLLLDVVLSNLCFFSVGGRLLGSCFVFVLVEKEKIQIYIYKYTLLACLCIKKVHHVYESLFLSQTKKRKVYLQQ